MIQISSFSKSNQSVCNNHIVWVVPLFSSIDNLYVTKLT
ncbi:hypothetical protein DDI_2128 [Dickeya dianthicola RNS04.9]|nr:hypothetical protein DDI_2128 [Dickeya dianthicola RNS04.9]